MAQLIRRLSSVQEDPGSNPTMGKNFSFWNSHLFCRAAQNDNAIANEINRGIHLAYTLFKLGNYIFLLDHLSYKHRFIAGSSKCSTKPLSILLTKLLTRIKQGLQKYCETSFSRSGVNQMWILKNSKELLEHHQSPNFNHITSIKCFDFPTLYTTIPHQKFKSRLATIIQNSFIHKNGNRRYKFLVFGREGPYFVKEHSDSKKQVHRRWHH